MPALAIDPVFHRDLFLLRQQLLRISEKYDVCDETGANILYVLDMSADPQHLMDRRIALALGVMLDTGERR
jgi:hypothetical protein